MKNLFLRWVNKRRYLQEVEIELLYDALYALCNSLDDMKSPGRFSGSVSDALDDAKKLLVVIKYERR